MNESLYKKSSVYFELNIECNSFYFYRQGLTIGYQEICLLYYAWWYQVVLLYDKQLYDDTCDRSRIFVAS